MRVEFTRQDGRQTVHIFNEFPTIGEIPKDAVAVAVAASEGTINSAHQAAVQALVNSGDAEPAIATPALIASHVVSLTDAYNDGLICAQTLLVAVNDLVSGVK